MIAASEQLQAQLDELAGSYALAGFKERARRLELALNAAAGAGISPEQRAAFEVRLRQIWCEFHDYQDKRQQAAELELGALQDCLGRLAGHTEGPLFRVEADRFSQLLAGSAALSRPQRDEVWGRYQELWQQRRAVRDDRQELSARARNEHETLLPPEVRGAAEPGGDEGGAGGVDRTAPAAPTTLAEWAAAARSQLELRHTFKGLQQALHRDERLLPADREAVLGRIRRLWQAGEATLEEAARLHRERAGQLLAEAARAVDELRPRQAAERLDELGRQWPELWLTAGERRQGRHELDQLWHRLRARRLEAQAAWQQGQLERLARWRIDHERLSATLNKIQANRWLNEDRLCDAQSDSQRQRLTEWIAEGERREQELNGILAGLQARIQEVEGRLPRILADEPGQGRAPGDSAARASGEPETEPAPGEQQEPGEGTPGEGSMARSERACGPDGEEALDARRRRRRRRTRRREPSLAREPLAPPDEPVAHPRASDEPVEPSVVSVEPSVVSGEAVEPSARAAEQVSTAAEPARASAGEAESGGETR